MLLLSLCGQCETLRINEVKIVAKPSTQTILDAHQVVLKHFKINLYLSKNMQVFQKVILIVFLKPGLIEAHSLKILAQVANFQPTTNFYIETIKIGSGVEARQRPKGRHVSTHISFERFPSPQGQIKQTLQQKLQVYKLL